MTTPMQHDWEDCGPFDHDASLKPEEKVKLFVCKACKQQVYYFYEITGSLELTLAIEGVPEECKPGARVQLPTRKQVQMYSCPDLRVADGNFIWGFGGK
jgi:hypothetical protein